MENIKNRYNSIDWLRFFSAISVICIHVNAIWLFGDFEQNTKLDFYSQHILNLLTRFSVPCFIMISGRFILTRQENQNIKWFYLKSLKKVIWPYVIVCIGWIIYYGILYVIIEKNIAQFVKIIIKGTYGNLWFVPMIVGLYIITPFLIRGIQNVPDRNVKICALVLLVWSMISNITSTYTLPYSIGVIFSYLAYYLVGYALRNVKLDAKKSVVGGGITFLLLFIAFLLRINGMTIFIKDPYMSFFSPAIIVYSIFVYLIFNTINIKKRCKWAKYTYYMYLIHTPVYCVMKTVMFKVLGETSYKVGLILLIIGVSIVSIILAFMLNSLYNKCWQMTSHNKISE